MYCEADVVLQQVVPQLILQQYCDKIEGKKPMAILIKYKITNVLAFDSLQNFKNLKLSKTRQSRTIINAGISNISLTKIILAATKHNW